LKPDGDGSNHLLKWELSGSEDGNMWVIVDRKETNDLNDNYVTKTFSCNVERSYADFYRYIRLQQTGKNSSGSDYLQLANIEFFGSMTKSTNKWMTIAAKSHTS
jgi:hypothetical protein